MDIWLDLEFTGIDIEKHRIREMAFVCGNYERHLKIGNGLTPFPGQVEMAFAAKTFLKNVVEKHRREGVRTCGDCAKYMRALGVCDEISGYHTPADSCCHWAPMPFRWAGYNVAYDILWIKKHVFPEFHPVWRKLAPDPLDVLSYMRKLKKSGVLNVPDCKLETVAAHFGIPHTPHNALSDIRATRFVWRRIREML